MKAYHIALCLFIFGFAVSGINDLGIYKVKAPESGVQGITDSDIKDISGSAMAAGLNPFYIPFIIITFAKALASGFLAILSILPWFVSTMAAFGVPIGVSIIIGMMIQGPIWWVLINGLYQWWTGYNYGGME
jgi:hypothetical protein